jgi:uncharacterized membrane protein
MKTTTKGLILASAVASLFASAAFAGEPAAKDGKAGGEVKCSGVNECKGKGGCASAKHDCAGKNGCKGEGWTKMGEKECKAKGGKIVADAKM